MPEDFQYDAFLSHSAKDKTVVRPLAERLRKDGLKVWFDEWVLKPGDSIPAKIEAGLEHSRVLVLCMSANAFGSDWAQLEGGTFRFRDPLNHERRFIPLRLDDAPIKGSLAQFLYINWLPADREEQYAKLLASCRLSTEPTTAGTEVPLRQAAAKSVHIDCGGAEIYAYAFSPDGKVSLAGCGDTTLRLCDVETGRCLRTLEGHSGAVWGVEWSSDRRRALSCSDDQTVRVWDVEKGQCLRVLKGHTSKVYSVVFSTDQRYVLSGSYDNTARL